MGDWVGEDVVGAEVGRSVGGVVGEKVGVIAGELVVFMSQLSPS